MACVMHHGRQDGSRPAGLPHDRAALLAIAAGVLALLALCGCGGIRTGPGGADKLQTPQEVHREVLQAVIEAYGEPLRDEGKIILENRWTAPSAIHALEHADLASKLPGLLPATFDAFRAAARSGPADWTPERGVLPRCDILEEGDALAAYARARTEAGPYQQFEARHELFLSMTPLGIDPARSQALVYTRSAWPDGRVACQFVLMDRGWMGWRRSAAWRFG